MTVDAYSTGTLGVTLVADEITVWQGLVVEIIATFVLVLAIFASCDRLRSDHGGSTALTIGFVVTMDIPWAVSHILVSSPLHSSTPPPPLPVPPWGCSCLITAAVADLSI